MADREKYESKKIKEYLDEHGYDPDLAGGEALVWCQIKDIMENSKKIAQLEGLENRFQEINELILSHTCRDVGNVPICPLDVKKLDQISMHTKILQVIKTGLINFLQDKVAHGTARLHETAFLDDLLNLEKESQPCYHKWRFFNRWCEECGDFEFTRTSGDVSTRHGVIVHQCVKCGLMWDEEHGAWAQEDIDNIFFNEFYWEDSAYYVNMQLKEKIKKSSQPELLTQEEREIAFHVAQETGKIVREIKAKEREPFKIDVIAFLINLDFLLKDTVTFSRDKFEKEYIKKSELLLDLWDKENTIAVCPYCKKEYALNVTELKNRWMREVVANLGEYKSKYEERKKIVEMNLKNIGDTIPEIHGQCYHDKLSMYVVVIEDLEKLIGKLGGAK